MEHNALHSTYMQGIMSGLIYKILPNEKKKEEFEYMMGKIKGEFRRI